MLTRARFTRLQADWPNFRVPSNSSLPTKHKAQSQIGIRISEVDARWVTLKGSDRGCFLAKACRMTAKHRDIGCREKNPVLTCIGCLLDVSGERSYASCTSKSSSDGS